LYKNKRTGGEKKSRCESEGCGVQRRQTKGKDRVDFAYKIPIGSDVF
jgi:hypothetical protein